MDSVASSWIGRVIGQERITNAGYAMLEQATLKNMGYRALATFGSGEGAAIGLVSTTDMIAKFTASMWALDKLVVMPILMNAFNADTEYQLFKNMDASMEEGLGKSMLTTIAGMGSGNVAESVFHTTLGSPEFLLLFTLAAPLMMS